MTDSHPELRTPRLFLRRPRLRDAPRIATLLNNYEVTKNLARVPYPYTFNMAVDWLVRQKRTWTPESITFALVDPEDGLVGFCGMHREGRHAEIGYWLGEPYWGQGLMSEAVREIIAWYFEATDAEGLVSGVFHFNKASLAIQHKLGFVEERIGTRVCLAQGREIDHIETWLSREAFDNATRESTA